jgi:hypothetical protein
MRGSGTGCYGRCRSGSWAGSGRRRPAAGRSCRRWGRG